MPSFERRKVAKKAQSLLKKELNDLQQIALIDLERFGWELKFIRHRLHVAVPVVFSSDRKKFAILDEDGELNENPGFEIRH